VARLNRAVALSKVWGPAPALEYVDGLGERLDGYHLFHATRAVLLRQLGRTDEAADADGTALRLTRNPAEQLLLRARLDGAHESTTDR
jgi:RNA polymerase sigma-70 factor (ECF subfamily)